MADTQQIEIEIPEVCGDENSAFTRLTHEGADYILFVDIKQDSDATSPSDDADKHAFLVYGHRDFSVDGPNKETAREIHESKSKWQRRYWVWPVYAYIHSGVRLQLGTDAGMPDRQWDVSMCGYCLVTRNKKEIPDAWKYAEGIVETWNQYLSGDVWGYDIALYKLEKDSDGDAIEERDYYERHGQQIEEDSCWGFYGEKYACEEAKGSAEGMVKGLTPKAA